MNPFKMRPERTGDLFVDWEKFWVKPYNKNEVNPYTRTRIILMNGTEFENVWFSHQFSRSVGDDELRRKLAYIRKSEHIFTNGNLFSIVHYYKIIGLSLYMLIIYEKRLMNT